MKKTTEKNVRDQAIELASSCEDSYSSDRYSNWTAVAKMLLLRGYTARQAEAMMRSKWTRWAADESGKAYGKVTSKDLQRFLDKTKNEMDEVRKMTEETFGMKIRCGMPNCKAEAVDHGQFCEEHGGRNA